MNQSDSLAGLKRTHTPWAIQKRLEEGVNHSYLKDFIYGAIDGAVTTFAVVSGVAGANLSGKIVIILGLANLVGDGFSMAVGNFMGSRAEEQLRDKARRIEESHIEVFPEGEKEEIRQIFQSKGFKGEELERVVEVITSDRQQWVNTMLKEELGLALETPSPFKAGFVTFSAFILVGSIPLIPFLYQLFFSSISFDPFILSAYMTAIAFFVVGAFKARFVGQRWVLAGLETLIIGGIAAFLAFSVGIFLKGIGS